MKTLDDLAAELQPTVFRLLDDNMVEAAGELVWTYRKEATAAVWREQLAELEQEVEATETAEAVEEAVEESAEVETAEPSTPLRGLDVLIPPKKTEDSDEAR